MKALITMSLLAFSSFCFADVSGAWHGTLTYQGQACSPVTLNVSTANNQFVVSAPQGITCGDQQFPVSETYDIEGDTLWAHQIQMGNITATSATAEERVFNSDEDNWTYWTFLTFVETDKGTLQVTLNLDGDTQITGELSK